MNRWPSKSETALILIWFGATLVQLALSIGMLVSDLRAGRLSAQRAAERLGLSSKRSTPESQQRVSNTSNVVALPSPPPDAAVPGWRPIGHAQKDSAQ